MLARVVVRRAKTEARSIPPPIRPSTGPPPRSIAERSFIALVCVTMLTPLVVFNHLLSFSAPKAFFFRILVEVTLPLYCYLLLTTERYRPNLKNPLTICLLAFLAVNLVSTFAGENILRSVWGNFERMGGSFNLAHLILFYLYLVSLAQMGEACIRPAITALIAAGGVTALDGFLVRITNNHFLVKDPYFPRVSAALGNPIYLPGFLVIPIFLNLYCLVREKRRWLQAVYLGLTGAELYCTWLSGTRAALVAIVVAAGISVTLFVLLTRDRKIRLAGSLALAAAAVVLGVGLVHFGDRLNPKDASTLSRLAQWKVALRGFPDHPILGTGPENYYVVANRYSLHTDAKGIYSATPGYDYTPWYDKPHNYLLEILVTTGLLGLLLYLAAFGITIWIQVRAFLRQDMRLGELCCLVAALIAYFVQNLFGFDTISSSLVWVAFLGMTGLWWRPHVRGREVAPSRRFVAGAVAVTAASMVVAIYAGNAIPLREAFDLGHGYLYSLSDPRKSLDYFEAARSLPFDVDPVKSSAMYSEFALDSLKNPLADKSLRVEILGNALAAVRRAIALVPDDPTEYQYVANLCMDSAIANHSPLDPQADEAIDRALALAPENLLLLKDRARIMLMRRNFAGAEQVLNHIMQEVPGDISAKIQLAEIYWNEGKPDAAMLLSEQAFKDGYHPQKARDVEWLGAAYEGQGYYRAAIYIYEMAVKIEPDNVDDYWHLAKVYGEIGRKKDAITIARGLARVKPSRAREMEDFIASLK